MAIFISPYIIYHAKGRIDEKHYRDLKKKMIQFKDGIMAVSFSLNVGYSIENSFKEALSELVLMYGEKSEIVKDFKSILSRLNRNENLEDVLEDYANDSEIEDINYFAEVFKYAKRSGGDLIAIINNTAETISEKVEVEREIETIISGKRLEQRVMTIVPIVIVIYLKLTSRDFIEPLYGNFFGMMIMSICLLLCVISDFIAKRIIRIEV